jgi:hypothetical protein
MKSKPLPRIPAAATRAGARKLQRTGSDMFALGFEIDWSLPTSDPGKGAAVVQALRLHFADRAVITWGGAQADAIFIRVL